MVSMEVSHCPRASISSLCEKLEQANQSLLDEIDYEHLRAECHLTDEELYEVGATALDCSIMLTMQRSAPQQLNSGYLFIDFNLLCPFYDDICS